MIWLAIALCIAGTALVCLALLHLLGWWAVALVVGVYLFFAGAMAVDA